MTSAGLIIAKAKSHRLTNKNTLPVNGEPMFLTNVKKCQKVFDRVYVSSDSNEILKQAMEVGAISIKRPKNLCGSTPNIFVYRHALEKISEDKIVAVQANSPTVESDLIRLVKNLMEEKDEVMTCHPNYKLYGSVWGLTKDRIRNYGNPRKPTPEVLIVDTSIDVHCEADYKEVIKYYEK